MKFKLEIEMENAAFEEQQEGYEASRILNNLANKIAPYSLAIGDTFPLKDVNGNRVGTATGKE